MEFSRRSFLHRGSQLGVAALVSGSIGRVVFARTSSPPSNPAIGTAVPNEAFNDPLYAITRAMFAQCLNTKFSLRLGPVRLGYMVLVAVEDMNPATYKSDGTSTRDCFSLVFRGLSDLPLEQRTYTVGHGKLGSFNLFIVPGDS